MSNHKALRKIWQGLKRRRVLDPRWNDFSEFAAWAIQEGWKPGLHIDKDICGYGSQYYGPDTCCVTTAELSAAVKDHHTAKAATRDLPPGVCLMNNRYVVKGVCTFDDAIAAHHSWCDAEAARLYRLAEKQTDKRIAHGIRWHADLHRLYLIEGPRGPFHLTPEQRAAAAEHSKKQYQKRRTPPQVLSRVCEHCGESFETVRPQQVFCKQYCSDHAKWQRRKETLKLS